MCLLFDDLEEIQVHFRVYTTLRCNFFCKSGLTTFFATMSSICLYSVPSHSFALVLQEVVEFYVKDANVGRFSSYVWKFRLKQVLSLCMLDVQF